MEKAGPRIEPIRAHGVTVVAESTAISDSFRQFQFIDRPPWPREEKHEEPPGIEPVCGMHSALGCGRGWRAGAVSDPGDPSLNAGGAA